MVDAAERTDRLARCELHQLHFDPSKASGCVLCRRSSLPALGEGRNVKRFFGLAAGATILFIAAGGLALWRHHSVASANVVRAAMPVATLSTAGRTLVEPGVRDDPRWGNRTGALSPDAVREALARIATARASCAVAVEDGCIGLEHECRSFEGRAGSAQGSFMLPTALRDACRGASSILRQHCLDGSLPACDAILGSGLFLGESRPLLERACDVGSARGCKQLVGILPLGSPELEAAKMRAQELENCSAQPNTPCAALSRAQLRSAAADSLKQQAVQNCRSGTVEDCSRLAALYTGPESRDLALSAELTEVACNRGDAGACTRLSDILAEGRGLPRDERRALELRDRGTAELAHAVKDCKGDDYACAMLQMAYVKGGGDWTEQFQRAELAPGEVAKECQAGKLGACEGLRAAYSGGASRLPPDLAKVAEYGARANQLLEQACNAGDRDACKTLAQYLLYSQPQDIARGRALADQACSRGGYLDCWILGEFLEHGPAGHDPATASAYYAKAVAAAKPLCDGGEVGACELVARAYSQGKGVSRDEKKHNDYLMKVVELSHVK